MALPVLLVENRRGLEEQEYTSMHAAKRVHFGTLHAPLFLFTAFYPHILRLEE